MAIPRFSFGSGASSLYNPNQVFVPTTLTSADQAQAEKYQSQSDAYNKAMEDFRVKAEAYNKAIEKYNAGPRTTEFTQKAPTRPADLDFTQADLDAFEVASTARAQQLQAARQNALNIMQNPEGFSQQYGIGSLGFEGGGEVPFFLEPESTRSKVPSQEELTNALLRYFPILQLLNRTSKVITDFYPDVVKSAVRAMKNPETGDEEMKELAYRTRTNTVDPILNMFGTSSESLGLFKEEKPPVYKTKFADGGAVTHGGIVDLNPSEKDQDMVSRIERFLEKNRP